MLRRCLSCYQAFPAQDALPGLPVGHSFAVDPRQGRLWIVCGQCNQWTLIPIDARWEQIEALERAVRDSARMLAQTANVALFQAGSVRILRVGSALGPEAAWWRYGTELRQRQARTERILFRGKVVDAIVAMALIGVPFWGYRDQEAHIERAATRQLGRQLWRGTARCVRCQHPLPPLRFRDRGALRVELWHDRLAVRQPCDRCGYVAAGSGAFLTGAGAEHVLRRALAFENFAGADQVRLDAAISLIEAESSPQQLLQRTAERGYALARIDATGTLALEMALHEEQERQWLELEVKELEARWREEELLAGIIDRELS